MILANETQQAVSYYISSSDSVQPEQGTIEVNGVVNLPQFDNLTNVGIQFSPAGDAGSFQIKIDDTHSGEQVQLAIAVE